MHVHLVGPSTEHVHYHDVRNHEHQNHILPSMSWLQAVLSQKPSY
jgi:hypothetical protein